MKRSYATKRTRLFTLQVLQQFLSLLAFDVLQYNAEHGLQALKSTLLRMAVKLSLGPSYFCLRESQKYFYLRT